MKNNTETLGSFGQFALALDHDFQELERLRGQFERLELESDLGLERGKKLLTLFSECGTRISEGVQGMAKELELARGRAEASAQFVSAQAQLVQKRQQDHDELLGRFHLLGETVKQVSTAIAHLKKPAGEPITDEQRALMERELPEIDSKLAMLGEQAMQLKADAQTAHMRSLERQADSLAQTLLSARRKVGAFVNRGEEAAPAPVENSATLH